MLKLFLLQMMILLRHLSEVDVLALLLSLRFGAGTRAAVWNAGAKKIWNTITFFPFLKGVLIRLAIFSYSVSAVTERNTTPFRPVLWGQAQKGGRCPPGPLLYFLRHGPLRAAFLSFGVGVAARLWVILWGYFLWGAALCFLEAL